MISLPELLKMYQNEYAYNELINQLKNTIPYVGAGLTCEIYPLWKQYLQQECLKYKIGDVEELFNNNLYEDIAELILNKIGSTAFYADLKATFSESKFKEKPLTGAISILPSLFQDTVITTNFDCALELTYCLAKCDFEKVLYPCFEEQISKTITGNRHNLIKIHGDISENSFIVFTRSQYEKVYGDPVDLNKPFMSFLKKCITGKTLLFLGCSLNVDRVTTIMESIMTKDFNIVHFALLEEPNEDDYAERVINLSKMGILPIFYPKGQHEYVKFLLEDLVKKNSM